MCCLHAEPGAGAQLGAMPAGMEPQAQAADRNPGDRGGNHGCLDGFKHAQLLWWDISNVNIWQTGDYSFKKKIALG